MKIDVDCPGCGKRYEVAESYAGKKSRCKQCGTSFRIPSPSAETGATSSRPPAAAHRPMPSRDRRTSRGLPGAMLTSPFLLHRRSFRQAPREKQSCSIARGASSGTKSMPSWPARSRDAKTARRCLRSRRRFRRRHHRHASRPRRQEFVARPPELHSHTGRGDIAPR